MITLQEEISVSQIDIDTVVNGFSEKFEKYIKIFRITFDYDFEIDIKKEYEQSVNLKQEILDFIKLQYSEIKVSFISNQLPF